MLNTGDVGVEEQLTTETQKTHNVKSADEVDKQIGEKICHLRMALGFTRQQLAERIGVTHQQLHKYEKGINRLSAGRLVAISEALGVQVVYFFDEDNDALSEENIQKQRMCMELMRDFSYIKEDRVQEALKRLIAALSNLR